MELNLFLSIALTLVYGNCGKNIAKLNTQSTFDSVKTTVISNSGSTLNSTEITVMPNAEITFNSEENTAMPNTETPLNSAENSVLPNEEISSTSTENSSEATPRNAVRKCPGNMYPYVLDFEEDNWTCFCPRPFLTVPINDTCAKPFRQGPCDPGHFVIQPSSKYKFVRIEPQCVPNSCVDDGLVLYEGTCRNITINRLCDYGQPHFNETTSEITCIYTSPHYKTALETPRRPRCPANSRPDRHGICRKKL